MATLVPGHRTILSIFPLEISTVLCHDGFRNYLHPVAPRDEILVREFIPFSGIWCPNHRNQNLSRRDKERNLCPECKEDLVQIPQWEDEHRPCDKSKGYTLLRVY